MRASLNRFLLAASAALCCAGGLACEARAEPGKVAWKRASEASPAAHARVSAASSSRDRLAGGSFALPAVSPRVDRPAASAVVLARGMARRVGRSYYLIRTGLSPPSR